MLLAKKMQSNRQCGIESGTSMNFDRIAVSPDVMGGRPCIRGTRVTVGAIVGLLAKGHSREEILRLYPYIKQEDVTQALGYAAWRSEEREVQLKSA
jgi:uncharacterized protein (DUF433 family)